MSSPYNIHGQLIMTTKLPDEIFKELKNVTLGEDYSKTLVGVLEDQYTINYKECPKFNKFIITQAGHFLSDRKDGFLFNHILQAFNADELARSEYDPNDFFDLSIGRMWLNSMGKGSYSPVHIHSGLFSFLVYLHIPFTREDEDKLNVGVESEKNWNGCTEFLNSYTHENMKISVDKTLEGEVIIFPSWTPHLVYPFRGEGRRITVSGNLYLQQK